MGPVRPDYQGACITNLIPALVSGVRPGWLPEALDGAEATVLLVLDGLGWRMLQERAEQAPVLSGLAGGYGTTVAPSTTGAALTSITTGLPPARHGVLGYRMRVGGQVLDVLGWRVPKGRPPDPDSVAWVPAFASAAVPAVTRADFERSGFTAASMRGARFYGWRTVATLVEHVRRLVAAGERLVYAYYDGIDKVAHQYGLSAPFLPAELAFTDRLVGDLLDALPASAALVVTADHGQVTFSEWVSLEPVASLVGTYAGDARFRYLHARAPGGAAALARAATDLCGERAWVFTRSQLIDEGWVGPDPPAGDVRTRIGDVVLAARGEVAFTDPTWPKEAKLAAGHGSLTEDEMLVPMLVGRGRS